MRSKYNWVEAWIDFSSDRHYVLLVRERMDGTIEIVDPAKNNKIICEFTQYEDALHWLNEDEYELVSGRCIIESDGAITSD